MPEYEDIIIDEVEQKRENGNGKMKYQAQSPDEAALVTAARGFGYVFTNRTPDTITVSKLDEEITLELLYIADFDNNRKRMSVVVREPETGEIFCYTKGNVIKIITITPKNGNCYSRDV